MEDVSRPAQRQTLHTIPMIVPPLTTTLSLVETIIQMMKIVGMEMSQKMDTPENLTTHPAMMVLGTIQIVTPNRTMTVK